MRLREVFVSLALENGIEKIYAPGLKKPDPLAFLASQIASGKMSLYRPKEVRRLCLTINGGYVEAIPDAYAGINSEKSILDKSDFVEYLSPFPYIVVDCKLRDIHSEKEILSLDTQIKKTLSVVRRFMWDERLVITGFRSEASAIHYPSTEDFLTEMNFEKVILLDPNGKDVFQGEKADCYIIGGIVDRSGDKKGTTELIYRRLAENGFDVERKRILLRNDVVGVPDRINHIAEIVLKCVIDGLNVERAIYDVQNRKIARWRLRKEIAKNAKRIKVSDRKFRVIGKSFFDEVRNWLKVNEDDFYKCARDMGVMVLGETLTSAKVLKIRGDL